MSRATRGREGDKAAFRRGQRAGYIVGEKLLGLVEAADRDAEFAQELPHFLDGIRGVFSLEETGDYARNHDDCLVGSDSNHELPSSVIAAHR